MSSTRVNLDKFFLGKLHCLKSLRPQIFKGKLFSNKITNSSIKLKRYDYFLYGQLHETENCCWWRVNVVLVHLNHLMIIAFLCLLFLVKHQFKSCLSRRLKITNFTRWKVNNDGANQVCKMLDVAWLNFQSFDIFYFRDWETFEEKFNFHKKTKLQKIVIDFLNFIKNHSTCNAVQLNLVSDKL